MRVEFVRLDPAVPLPVDLRCPEGMTGGTAACGMTAEQVAEFNAWLDAHPEAVLKHDAYTF